MDERARADQARPLRTRQDRTPHMSTPSVQQRDRVIIRFAGDSGDGMQLTGDRFTSETAQLGNDLSTLPNFPAEIRAPQGTLPGVSSFQLHFADHDVLTPGDAPDVLVAMNPAALKANLADVPHVHMIAVGGSGMSGVARLFLADGVQLSGSDNVELPVLDDLRARAADGSKVLHWCETEIKDTDGEVVGRHEGAYAYTVGQRRGLGLKVPRDDHAKRYVVDVQPKTNTVVVGTADLLGVDVIEGSHARWPGPPPVGEVRLGAQLRAHGEEFPATVTADDDRVVVRLDARTRGVAPGQSVVLYEGTRVVGSATITATSRAPR